MCSGCCSTSAFPPSASARRPSTIISGGPILGRHQEGPTDTEGAVTVTTPRLAEASAAAAEEAEGEAEAAEIDDKLGALAPSSTGGSVLERRSTGRCRPGRHYQQRAASPVPSVPSPETLRMREPHHPSSQHRWSPSRMRRERVKLCVT